MVAVSILSVRNWHNTQSWIAVAVWERCPWQLWWTQSEHSVSATDELALCTWSDDKTSIGTNTANSIHEAICLFVVSFTGAKIVLKSQNLLKLIVYLRLFEFLATFNVIILLSYVKNSTDSPESYNKLLLKICLDLKVHL